MLPHHRRRPESPLAEYGLLIAFLALWLVVALDAFGVFSGL